jgi:hypothetical protein
MEEIKDAKEGQGPEATTTAVHEEAKAEPAVKKKKPLALFVVLGIGAILIVSAGYDRLFSNKANSAAATAKESPEKLVALLPPPPQPVQATTTTPPGGTPPKKQMTKPAVADWVNNLRKAIMSPALGDNVKLDQVAESWLTAKLMNMNPETTISQAVAHNGNHPIHVLHSGVIDNSESALVDKLAPVAGVKEIVSSTLYDAMGVYVHPLTVEKCHVVVVLQSKSALPTRPANWGSAAFPQAASVCDDKQKKAGVCPAPENAAGAPAVAKLPSAVAATPVKKTGQSKYPIPMPPPAFGGNVIDVPPPSEAAKLSQVKEVYEPYPDTKNKAPVHQ